MPKSTKQINWSLLPTGETWTTEYAWWLGLTFGDGCVDFKPSDYRYRVSLSSNKAEQATAEKWRALICPEATVHDVSDNGIETVFYHSEFAQWFARAWWSGDKMLNMRYPAGKIPAAVFRHWVRGLIDSDGGVHLRERERGNPALIISFDSSVPGFTNALAQDLWSAGLPKVGVTTTKKKDAKTGKIFLGWRLKWSNASAIVVADWLYEGSAQSIREDGRYTTYQEALKQRAGLALPCTACGQKPKFSGGLCKQCLWKTKPKQSDKPCSVCWSRPCTANDMCNACFKAGQRPAATRAKRVYGACSGCKDPLRHRGVRLCPACAKRNWEAATPA